MTLIFFSPKDLRTTVNSVCSSVASPPPAAGAATATGAAALTPNLSSKTLTRSAASKRVNPLNILLLGLVLILTL